MALPNSSVEELFVVMRPAAVESMREGIWEASPSPTVSRV